MHCTIQTARSGCLLQLHNGTHLFYIALQSLFLPVHLLAVSWSSHFMPPQPYALGQNCHAELTDLHTFLLALPFGTLAGPDGAPTSLTPPCSSVTHRTLFYILHPSCSPFSACRWRPFKTGAPPAVYPLLGGVGTPQLISPDGLNSPFPEQ